MDALGMTLIFTLSGTTTWLLCAAGAATVWELLSLVRSLYRTYGLAGAGPLALACVGAGPVTAAGAAIYGGMVTPAGQAFRGRTLVWAGLRGTVVALLASLALAEAYRDEIALSQSTPNGALLALCIAAVLWALRSYSRTTSPLKRPAKAALLALRLVVIVLLAIWAARPVLEYEKQIEVPGVVLVGLDASTSMTLRDMPSDYTLTSVATGATPVSRIDSVRQALDDTRGEFERIAAQARLRVFPFAGGAGLARGLAPDEGSAFARAFELTEATGKTTAIGDSASAASDPSAVGTARIAAIVLITDGCNNTAETISPEQFATLMGSRRVPIYTVGVGSAEVTRATRTLTVRNLAAADEVEAFNRLPITAVVETIGLQGKRVTVTCRFGDKKVDAKSIVVAKSYARHAVRFEHVPISVGFKRLTVKATVTGPRSGELAGEPIASKLVHVVDRNLRILYVEGRFRYETKYVTAALAGEGRFTVDRRILLQPLKKGQGGLTDNEDDWLGYHAIILGDVPADRFTPKQLEIIKKLVGEYGKGLCMLGGSESFGRGGWGDTPIADIMGPDLARSNGQIKGEVTVSPTPAGLASEIMRIGADPQAVAEAWKSLGALSGANALVVTKPAAAVLAQSAKGEPLVVAQPYGKGRTLAVAFDTTWQWVLSPDDTADLQKRFWRQVALYLSAPKGNVWITTDRPRYDLGRLLGQGRNPQTIRVTAGVEDVQGRPLLSTPVTATVTGPEGTTRPVTLQAEKNMRRAVLGQITAPGEYVLKIATTVAGKPLSAEHRFEVIHRDIEALDVLANFDLLKRVADESDGQFARLGELKTLLEAVTIAAEPKQEIAFEHDKLTERFRWPLVIALIALLCAEWSLRKRKGLV